jgi:hypothetical protein
MKNAKICNDSCRGKKCMSRSKRYKYAACINLQLDVRMWPIGVYIYMYVIVCVKQHQRMYMRLCSIVPALRCRFSWNAVSSHPRRLYTFDFLIYVMSFTPCMNASLNVCLCVCFDLKSGSLLSCIVYTWNVFTLWTVGECDRSRHCTVWPVMQTSRFMHGSARVQGRVRPPLLPTSSFSLSACLPLSLSPCLCLCLCVSLSLLHSSDPHKAYLPGRLNRVNLITKKTKKGTHGPFPFRTKKNQIANYILRAKCGFALAWRNSERMRMYYFPQPLQTQKGDHQPVQEDSPASVRSSVTEGCEHHEALSWSRRNTSRYQSKQKSIHEYTYT